MNEPADKKGVLLRFLERGMAMVHIDPRRELVVLPDHLLKDAHVCLNLSWRFPDANMTVDEFGVRARLHFGGTPYVTALPWPSIFAISSYVTGEGFAWQGDIPEEVVRSLAEQAAQKRKRPRLSPVPSDDDLPPESPPHHDPPPPRSHLRLVK